LPFLGAKSQALLGVLATALVLSGCTARTLPATNVSANTATFNASATVRPGDTGGTLWWEYSNNGGASWTSVPADIPSRAWGNSTNPPCDGHGAESNPFPISRAVSGLSSGSHYIYRIRGTVCGSASVWFDSAGTTNGTAYSSFDTPVSSAPADIVFLSQPSQGAPAQISKANADGTSPSYVSSATMPGGQLVSGLALSPDGRSIAFAYGNNIAVEDISGAQLRTVYDGSEGSDARQPRWSPDGTRLIFVADVSVSTIRGHVYTVRPDGTGLLQLNLQLPSGQTRVADPSYSPDGNRLVFSTYNDSARDGHICLANVDGSSVQCIYSDPRSTTSTSYLRETMFSPDGSAILFTSAGDEGELTVQTIRGNGLGRRQLTSAQRDPGSNQNATWSPNGRLISFASSDYRNQTPSRIKTMDANGANARVLFPTLYSTSNPSYRQASLQCANPTDCAQLNRYVPELRYDSQESYHADSAAEITDNWGDNVSGLWQYSVGGQPYSNALLQGTQTIATSSPYAGVGSFGLSLAALGATYPSAVIPSTDDWIDERNDHYVEDARALSGAGYGDQIYGRAVRDGSGKLWLQYWFFYYYNSFNVLGVGVHEGDWEMVQVRLDSQNHPDQVVYAEHSGASRCGAGEFQTTASGAPIVYAGLGSHASYPRAGIYDIPNVPDDDHADGVGGSVVPAVAVVGNPAPEWLAWPGHWGNSRGGGLNQASPTGPAFHSQWTDPSGWAQSAGSCLGRLRSSLRRGRSSAARRVGRPLLVAAELHGQRVEVTYRIVGRLADGEVMLLSLKGQHDRLPAMSFGLRHPHRVRRVRLPFKVTTTAPFTVLASVFARGGPRSDIARRRVNRLGQ
jgi:Tol biopolymer transport system component